MSDLEKKWMAKVIGWAAMIIGTLVSVIGVLYFTGQGHINERINELKEQIDYVGEKEEECAEDRKRLGAEIELLKLRLGEVDRVIDEARRRRFESVTRH